MSSTRFRPGPRRRVTSWDSSGSGSSWTWSSLPSFVVKSPEEIARAGVQALEKGRRHVAPGIVSAVSALSGHYTPRTVLLPLLRRFYPVGMK